MKHSLHNHLNYLTAACTPSISNDNSKQFCTIFHKSSLDVSAFSAILLHSNVTGYWYDVKLFYQLHMET